VRYLILEDIEDRMPTSNFQKFALIAGFFQRDVDDLKVKSVLDVGVGFGKTGFACREWLDVRRRQNYKKEDWEVKIDGVEIWEKYITPVHDYIYNNVHIGDIYNIADTLDHYDVIFMLDVIEHMEKRRGVEILRKLYDRTNMALMLSFPEGTPPGKAPAWENPYEAHLSTWRCRDVVGILPKTHVVRRGVTVSMR